MLIHSIKSNKRPKTVDTRRTRKQVLSAEASKRAAMQTKSILQIGADLSSLSRAYLEQYSTNIENISFRKDTDGKIIALKDGYPYSGMTFIKGDNKKTRITFSMGKITKSLQTTLDGKFIFQKEYKYPQEGVIVVEITKEGPDKKLVKERAVCTKNSYHLSQDSKGENDPIIELANFKKSQDGTIVAMRLLEDEQSGTKQVRRTVSMPLEDESGCNVTTTEILDYNPGLYKFMRAKEEYSNTPIQTLTKLNVPQKNN